MKKDVLKIEISHRTIIFTVLFLISIYGIYLIKDIIFILFIAILLTTAFNPLVTFLEKYRIPRGLGIWIVYILFFGSLIAAISAIVPPLIDETIALLSQIPFENFTKYISSLEINLQDIQIIANQLTSIPKALRVITSAFGVAVVIITLLAMTFYLLIERKQLHTHLVWMFGNDGAEARAEKFVREIEHRVGTWIRGQLTLMFLIGLATYTGLRLLNIDYALPLAILAGLLEIIPNIGPTVSAIPAIIVAYITFSLPMAVAVTALYFLVQQIECNFLTPKIMQKIIGLNPVVTILILLTGFRLGGIGLAALSIPLFLLIRVIFQELYSHSTLVKKK